MQHIKNTESIVCVYDDVWCIYSGEYISRLCQGQATCALNLPSCRCTEMGQMSLEGSYWGVGGDSLKHFGFVSQPRMFKGSV